MAVKPPPARGTRIDWSRIIFDLERCGMSQREIGRECDVDATSAGPWVNKLKNGIHSEPGFHKGALLLGLWALKMQSVPDAAPKERV